MHAWLLRTHPEGLTTGWVAGRLFQLPEGTAALVPGPEPSQPPPGPGWVRGDFVGYEGEEDLASALADLDPLEGVEKGQYIRAVVPVLLEGGPCFQAWAYLYPPERLPQLERLAIELPGGDWTAYLG